MMPQTGDILPSFAIEGISLILIVPAVRGMLPHIRNVNQALGQTTDLCTVKLGLHLMQKQPCSMEVLDGGDVKEAQ